MRNLVRFNPTRAPQEKPIGGAPNIAHVASMVDGPLFAHLGHFAQPRVLRAGHNTDGHFIQGAIKHPGAETAAAKRAGKSTHEYMEEHKNDSGTAGKRARLGLTLSRLAKRRKK